MEVPALKTETLARYGYFAIALITGVGLTAASVYLAGVIAALPIPRLPAHLRHDHRAVLLVTLDLVGALPLTLAAWVVGRLLFRALREASHQSWIAVGLP
jgi:ABC-type enterobactin transport system permease subunit